MYLDSWGGGGWGPRSNAGEAIVVAQSSDDYVGDMSGTNNVVVAEIMVAQSSDIDDEGYVLLANTLKAQNEAFEVLLDLPSARQKIYTLETLFNQFVEKATTTLECGQEYDRELIKTDGNDGKIGKILVAMRPRRKAKAAAKKPHGQPKITSSDWKTIE